MSRNVRRSIPAAQEETEPDLEHRIREAALARVPEETVQTDLRELFRGAVKATLELVLEETVKEIVGAKKWERTKSRVDAHNGSYMRGLLTSLGHVDLRMPRARKGGAPVDVLGAYERR